MTTPPLNQKLTALVAIRDLDTGYGVANADLAKSIGAKTPAAKARLNIVVHSLRTKKFVVNLHTGIYQVTEPGRQEILKSLAKIQADEQRAAKAAVRKVQALPVAQAIDVPVSLKAVPAAHQAGPGALDAILSHLVSSICAELTRQLLPALVQTLDKTIGTAALEIATRPAEPAKVPTPVVFEQAAIGAANAAVIKAARVDAPIATPKAPPKFAPFKVAVVGLRGDQVAMIKSEYASKLDLRFIDGSKNCAADIRVATHQCDHVVAMLDFVSHSDSDVARAGTAKYIGLHGGMSTLRNKLNDIVLAHETRIAAVAA